MNSLNKSCVLFLFFIALSKAAIASAIRLEFVSHHSTTIARFSPELQLMQIDREKFSLDQKNYQTFLSSLNSITQGQQSACEDSPNSFVRFIQNNQEVLICDLEKTQKIRLLLNQLQMVSKKQS